MLPSGTSCSHCGREGSLCAQVGSDVAQTGSRHSHILHNSHMSTLLWMGGDHSSPPLTQTFELHAVSLAELLSQ